ncbi:transcriptional regulator [Cereibacter sphaeroides]|uniref:helix-turn-helix domain-containing protein n=1 Tax=Cereibacter johrii TaxID=445629 RepID=UPI000C6DAF6F|nr:transcriptional regulator [Cereibacter johrii]MEA5161216.1 transcriptional regulator [Cereibacter johrii]QCP84891.1 transcriptional regulator [Cereibacter sphaeroides]RDS94023.1 transcriptional regulator [Cereibacter sphaeroides f. sp. denitrificans]
MPKSHHRETARLVRHRRWVLGLSQEDFAARLGLDVTDVRALEAGRPSAKTISSTSLVTLLSAGAAGATPIGRG